MKTASRVFSYDDLTLMTQVHRDPNQFHRYWGNVTFLRYNGPNAPHVFLGMLRHSSVIAPSPEAAARKIVTNAMSFATGPNWWDWGENGTDVRPVVGEEPADWTPTEVRLYRLFEALGGDDHSYGMDDDEQYPFEEHE